MMKKIMALALAAVMVLGMSVMTMAGSITLKNTVTDETYEVYKVFDATTGTNGAVSYTVPQNDEGNDIYSAADLAELFDTVNNGGKTYVTPKSTANDSDITDWASTHHVTTAFTTANGSTGNDVAVSNVPDGYYYIKSSLNNGSVIMVTSVTPDAIVYEKNDEPGWGDGGKTVEQDGNSHTYTVGETISYKLDYKNAANYGNGEKVTQYTITDTMPTGIDLNTDSIVIKVKEADGTEHTITSDDATTWTVAETGFTIVIPWVNADTIEKSDSASEDYFLYNAPATITVTYTAKMTSDAGVAIADTNQAQIYPDTEPDNHVTKEVDVSTGMITITKLDGADKTTPLEATFVLKNDQNQYLVYDETNDSYSWDADIDNATPYVTENGQVVISGIEAGTYTLVETIAPSGYNLLTSDAIEPITLQVVSSTVGTSGDTTYTFTKLAGSATVYNNKGTELPSTGGIGTTIFYVLGAVLVLGGGILLVSKRRAA